MNLPAAPWEAALLPLAPVSDPALASITASLSQQRRIREVSYRLRAALREVDSDYSFFRVEGLKKLLSSLDAFSSEDEWIQAFCESQKDDSTRVFTALMNKSIFLSRQMSEPLETEDGFLQHPSSSEETFLALRVLNGCFLIDPLSRTLSAASDLTEVLIEKISQVDCGEEMCSICLDCLISMFLENPICIKKFCDSNNFDVILECIQNKEVEYSIRTKCVEFIQLFLDQILPSVSLDPDWSNQFLDSFFATAIRFLGSDAVSLLKTKGSNVNEIPAYGRLKTRAQHVIQSIRTPN